MSQASSKCYGQAQRVTGKLKMLWASSLSQQCQLQDEGQGGEIITQHVGRMMAHFCGELSASAPRKAAGQEGTTSAGCTR
eukprot:363309-Chlamydomonas_euryale.AAC.5